MERELVASTVAEALWSTERAMDTAFAELAGLLGTVTRTRQDANLSMLVAQDAVNELAAALPEMTAVRDRLIAAHRRLERWQKRMGMDLTEMGGGGTDKPPSAVSAPVAVEVLREVA